MARGDYARYRRKPDAGPGWPEIWVLEDQRGELPAKGEAQCATLDRIPFCMKVAVLVERYDRVKV